MPAGQDARGALLPALRRAARSGARSGRRPAGCACSGYVAALAEQGPTRGPAARLRQRAHRQGPDDRARRDRRLQRGVDQGAQPRGPPVPRDAARPRRRQRASDEGRGAVPEPVARARGRAAGRRRRARRGAGARAAAPGGPTRRSRRPRAGTFPGILAGGSLRAAGARAPRPPGRWRQARRSPRRAARRARGEPVSDAGLARSPPDAAIGSGR